MNARNRIFNRLVFVTLAAITVIFMSGCTTAPKAAAQKGQLYHIGLIWLKEPGNAEQKRKIIGAAHAFAREIPEVQFLSVGQTLPSSSPYVDASFDVCVVMRFADKAALDRYGKHPTHEQAAKEAFLPLSRKILFYDFISE